MRVDWCVSSWFRIKNTHSLTLCVCVCVRDRGAASAAAMPPAVCGGRRLLLAAWRKTRLATRQGLMLWRDVRRMRPGGEGACVTTLLEMPFGAQR